MNKKPKNKSLLKALRGETGAIDLASIMVGIIVIGLIGGVIAATVFAVIPWAQDNAAKQSLRAVETAQNAFSGLAVDGTVSGSLASAAEPVSFAPGQKFATAEKLVELKLLSSNEKVSTTVGQDGACYVAAVTSATGNVFYNTSKDLAIKKVESTTPDVSWCGSFPGTVNPGTPETPESVGCAVDGDEAPWPLVDAGLASKIAEQLGKTADSLTLSDAAALENNNLIFLDWNGITTAKGLERACGVTALGAVYADALADDAGFENIVSMESLEISSPVLKQLDGFNALETVNGFNISDSGVETITGFNGLKSSGGDFEVKNNNGLKSIDGFNSLESVHGSFYLSSNYELQSLKGFDALKSIDGQFTIYGASKLAAVSGFNTLEKVGAGITLTGNSGLTAITGFNGLKATSSFTIDGNNPGTVITGFNSIEKVNAKFWIGASSVKGFQKLTSVGSSDIKINFIARSFADFKALAA